MFALFFANSLIFFLLPHLSNSQIKAIKILAGIAQIFLCRKMNTKGALRDGGDWGAQDPPPLPEASAPRQAPRGTF